MLPKKLHDKYLARFDFLIKQGEEILKDVKIVPGKTYLSRSRDDYLRKIPITEPDEKKIDYSRYSQWKINFKSLLSQVIPDNHVHQKLLEEPKNWDALSNLRDLISRLKAIKNDFEQDFLGDLSLQIEAEIAADYMGQAEQLLNEGQSGKYDHVPAAVLSGAVLEKDLRTLCDKQNPPIPTTYPDGKPKMLNRLIHDLTEKRVFNQVVVNQLNAWAHIRNKAAHGEFDQFTRSDVEIMIQGIKNFLADYMT